MCFYHRTGITPAQFDAANESGSELAFTCAACSATQTEVMDVTQDVTVNYSERTRHNSTATEDQMAPQMDIDVSPLRTLDVSRRGEGIPDVIPDVTFNLTGRQFHRQAAPLDDSLPDRALTDDIPADAPVTFEIVESGTKRGAPKLVSSDGFTYTRGVQTGTRRYWRCSVRNKATKCPASVKEFNGVFSPGVGGHIHPADPGAAKSVKIAKKVKEIAKERMFEPVTTIVERVMKEMVTTDDVNLPKLDNLTRAANHHRRLRPDDPTDLQFQSDQDFIGEDFTIEDIHMDGARHIVFGTAKQLDLLRQSKRWFIDGTFKVVKAPFYQLSTIHAFVKKGNDEKQVPLAYAVMSRRTKDDYVQVLTSLRNRLGRPLVEWFMLDFEAATWQAIRHVFPGSVLKGCVFHLTQRFYRKIQAEGLHTAYIQKGDKYEFLRKLMSLPYLPAEQITPAYDRLKEVAEEAGGPVLRVVQYVDRTWIRGSLWEPSNWCVFREVVRTNNDLEDGEFTSVIVDWSATVCRY